LLATRGMNPMREKADTLFATVIPASLPPSMNPNTDLGNLARARCRACSTVVNTDLGMSAWWQTPEHPVRKV